MGQRGGGASCLTPLALVADVKGRVVQAAVADLRFR